LNRSVGEQDAQRLSTHSPRKTFAARNERSGHDLLLVRDAFGHSSVSITQKYLEPERAQLEEMVLKNDWSRQKKCAVVSAELPTHRLSPKGCFQVLNGRLRNPLGLVLWTRNVRIIRRVMNTKERITALLNNAQVATEEDVRINARYELLINVLPAFRRIAGSLRSRSFDDLVQEGVLAAIDVIFKIRPDQHEQFVPVMSVRARYRMLDFLS
jgi:hypothetical protein